MNFSAPPPPPPPPQPATPHTQDVVPFDSAGNNTSVCVAFLHNCCQNGNRCRFLHRNDKTGIIFCKEFLKIASCKKPTCRFIHATLAEQKAYKEKGVILPSLQSRINTVENLNNLLTQYYSNQQWVPQKNMVNHLMPPPPPPATTAQLGQNTNGNHLPSSSMMYTSNSITPPVTFPINTSIPPPNFAQQLGYHQRFNSVTINQPPPPLTIGYQNWVPSINQPPPPPYDSDNGPPPPKKSVGYNIRCQKCCYNHSKLKQSNQEVEILMQQQADLNLNHKKLEDLFKELRAGAMLIMKDCENPEIRSLLRNHLKATEPTDETVELHSDHVNNYHQYQVHKYPNQNTGNGITMQQKLLLLISDKKQKLHQLKNTVDS